MKTTTKTSDKTAQNVPCPLTRPAPQIGHVFMTLLCSMVLVLVIITPICLTNKREVECRMWESY